MKIAIYPTASSYRYYKRTGLIATAPISDALESVGIKHIDLHVFFADYLDDRSYCEILTMPESCQGHYSPEGNLAVATALKEVIQPMIKNSP